jgi:hypothetical protein
MRFLVRRVCFRLSLVEKAHLTRKILCTFLLTVRGEEHLLQLVQCSPEAGIIKTFIQEDKSVLFMVQCLDTVTAATAE